MKRFRALMIVAACALTGVALPVLAGGFGDGFGTGGVSISALGSFYCALTGCTMTGQRVSSGVAVDDTTGTNEDFVIGPNGSGTLEVAKTSQSGTSETLQRWTVSDVTTTKFFARLLNVVSVDAAFAADLRAFTNSTVSTVPGFQYLAGVPVGADLVANTGINVINCVTSTDGSTGTIAAPTARPCHTFRALATDRAHVGWGGAWIDEPQTLTVADNGGGTAAAGTLNPSAGFHLCTCNDANGCTITVGETAVRSGQRLTVACTATNVCNFADTAGVTELAGAFACGQYDTLELRYQADRWVETGRSDN